MFAFRQILPCVLDKFITNCKAYYLPKKNVEKIEEKLQPIKSRFPFIQYMPEKPDEFGIQFWILEDSKPKHRLNAFPY